MADSLSRITSMLETARDLTLEAAAVASAKLAETPTHLRPQEVSSLLSSRAERDVLKGLKYITLLISKGEDASQFFTDVVKNVSSSNLKIRKLVYTYLLRYADKENDLALLSINAIQKSLGDKNEQVRSLAIRVMSEIKIGSIYPIVLLGIKKCVNDQSPLVRQSAAISLVKLFNNYGESSKDELVESIKKLLKDTNVNVLGSTILAYRDICPNNFDLLHGHYRRFISLLDEFDDWSQIYTIEIFTNYARLYLPKPKIINTASDNDHEFIELPESYNGIPFPVYDVEYHPDLLSFLNKIKKLTYSRNEAVVLAVGRSYFHLTPPKTFREAQIPASLVRILLTGSKETQNFVLQSILYMAIHDSTNFVQYEKRFYLLPKDDFNNSQFKLKILSVICNENNIKSIITELQYYVLNSEDPRIAVESVKSIGICSQISEFWSSKILKWLLNELSNSNRDKLITSEFLNVIRYLVQQNKIMNIKTVAKLSLLLDNGLLVEDARETVIWLVGEFCGIESKLAPDILRKLMKNFSYETTAVRYQIILLASKVYSYDLENYKEQTNDINLDNYKFDGTISELFSYAINLGRYDDDYDIRDRSRMFYSLLNSKQTQLASLILQAPKPVPIVALKRINDPLEISGTAKENLILSLPIDDIVRDYNTLPNWNETNSLPPDSIRDEFEVKAVAKSISPQSLNTINSEENFKKNGLKSFTPQYQQKKYKLQSLDDFFANEIPIPTTSSKRKVIYKEESESESSSEEETSEDSEEEEEEEDEGEEDEEEEEEEEDGDEDEDKDDAGDEEEGEENQEENEEKEENGNGKPQTKADLY
ncbi:hypothetical protein WICMUC_004338 [Wickerhamomyces mucosus]|uniref:Clathrin/coatomer adaptor adaptin-like N-terminal domain-containing protein n=1 Tax=Wickerhamomyces mucosus TaxID=1378264 RepID=A0A9P8TAB3_9ASCO|nr:hypothetical protein WICMUC_004338 [Wickerhamomyces mucosus]